MGAKPKFVDDPRREAIAKRTEARRDVPYKAGSAGSAKGAPPKKATGTPPLREQALPPGVTSVTRTPGGGKVEQHGEPGNFGFTSSYPGGWRGDHNKYRYQQGRNGYADAKPGDVKVFERGPKKQAAPAPTMMRRDKETIFTPNAAPPMREAGDPIGFKGYTPGPTQGGVKPNVPPPPPPQAAPKGNFQGYGPAATPVQAPPVDPAAAAAGTDKLRADLQMQQAKDAMWVKQHPGVVTPGMPATGWNAGQWPTPPPNPLGNAGGGMAAALQELLGIKPAMGGVPASPNAAPPMPMPGAQPPALPPTRGAPMSGPPMTSPAPQGGDVNGIVGTLMRLIQQQQQPQPNQLPV